MTCTPPATTSTTSQGNSVTSADATTPGSMPSRARTRHQGRGGHAQQPHPLREAHVPATATPAAVALMGCPDNIERKNMQREMNEIRQENEVLRSENRQLVNDALLRDLRHTRQVTDLTHNTELLQQTVGTQTDILIKIRNQIHRQSCHSRANKTMFTPNHPTNRPSHSPIPSCESTSDFNPAESVQQFAESEVFPFLEILTNQSSEVALLQSERASLRKRLSQAEAEIAQLRATLYNLESNHASLVSAIKAAKAQSEQALKLAKRQAQKRAAAVYEKQISDQQAQIAQLKQVIETIQRNPPDQEEANSDSSSSHEATPTASPPLHSSDPIHSTFTLPFSPSPPPLPLYRQTPTKIKVELDQLKQMLHEIHKYDSDSEDIFIHSKHCLWRKIRRSYKTKKSLSCDSDSDGSSFTIHSGKKLDSNNCPQAAQTPTNTETISKPLLEETTQTDSTTECNLKSDIPTLVCENSEEPRDNKGGDSQTAEPPKETLDSSPCANSPQEQPIVKQDGDGESVPVPESTTHEAPNAKTPEDAAEDKLQSPKEGEAPSSVPQDAEKDKEKNETKEEKEEGEEEEEEEEEEGEGEDEEEDEDDEEYEDESEDVPVRHHITVWDCHASHYDGEVFKPPEEMGDVFDQITMVIPDHERRMECALKAEQARKEALSKIPETGILAEIKQIKPNSEKRIASIKEAEDLVLQKKLEKVTAEKKKVDLLLQEGKTTLKSTGMFDKLNTLEQQRIQQARSRWRDDNPRSVVRGHNSSKIHDDEGDLVEYDSSQFLNYRNCTNLVEGKSSSGEAYISSASFSDDGASSLSDESGLSGMWQKLIPSSRRSSLGGLSTLVKDMMGSNLPQPTALPASIQKLVQPVPHTASQTGNCDTVSSSKMPTERSVIAPPAAKLPNTPGRALTPNTNLLKPANNSPKLKPKSGSSASSSHSNSTSQHFPHSNAGSSGSTSNKLLRTRIIPPHSTTPANNSATLLVPPFGTKSPQLKRSHNNSIH
ncbi:hypothetical protein Pelo_6500 [Pelomyxa schiedti]|nr:hypothetical protein Pelo_6500 [Pelomyxa schiedti]